MFILFLYYLFSFAFTYGLTSDTEDNFLDHIISIIISAICGWAIFPFVLGQTIKKLMSKNN